MNKTLKRFSLYNLLHFQSDLFRKYYLLYIYVIKFIFFIKNNLGNIFNLIETINLKNLWSNPSNFFNLKIFFKKFSINLLGRISFKKISHI